MSTVDHQEADVQSTETSDATSATYEIPNNGGEYMPLNPSTRSWEINREQVDIITNIGKGAFSQVAKATVKNINDNQQAITLAVKMLKGYGYLSFKILVKTFCDLLLIGFFFSNIDVI